MRKGVRKENIFERAAETFDLPGEVVAGQPQVTITGFRRVFVENHKGLLEYGDNVISLKCGRGVIKVRGNRLDLRSMTDAEILITGEIDGVDFEM